MGRTETKAFGAGLKPGAETELKDRISCSWRVGMLRI